MKACLYPFHIPLIPGKPHQLLLLCILLGFSRICAGQHLITMHDIPAGMAQKKPVEKQKALSQALRELEQMHQITFVYENKLIDGKYLSQELSKSGAIDEKLGALLPQFGLKYKKLGKGFYSIGPGDGKAPKRAPLLLNKSRSQLEMRDTRDFSVRGRITNELGEGMVGVTVVLKGSTVGTSSDPQGNYTLSVSHGNGTLVFSFIGYLPQEVAINNRSTINVAMALDAKALEEIVVVGYGEQKRTTVTGSMAAVQQKDIENIKTSNLTTGLAGKLPGLRVKQNSSEPGSFTANFDIRGFGTPLIVVDGMVMESRDFARLDPNTIENITILKDASAAVYGVKAANGVVLVTTKKGESGKPTVTYTGSYGMQKFTKTPQPMDAYQFAEYSTEIEMNSGKSPNETTFRQEDLQDFKSGKRTGTDWYGLVTRDYSTQANHNLSISGGSDRIRYFTSVGLLDERGMWKSGDLNYKKYNLRANITSHITDNLEMQLNINGMQDNKNEPGSPAFIPGSIGGIYFSLFMQAPTVPVYANNTPPYLSDTYDGQHPLAITDAAIGGYTKTGSRTFQGTYTLNYQVPFITGLSAKLSYGYYNLDEFQKIWKPKYLMYRYEATQDVYLNTATKNDPINMSADYNSLQRTNLLGQLNYRRSFLDKHNLHLTGIFEERIVKSDNLWAKSEFDANVDQLFAGTKNQQVSSNEVFENRNKSVISRLTYDYAQKYLFESGFNFGGSSLFPENKRWGFFPYVSAGWRLSQEKFFKDKVSLVTNLKLRGSWGQMGDDRAAAFQFLKGYYYPRGNYIIDDQVVPGLGFRDLPNPNITWNTVTSKNIGFELELKNGLFNVEFDLFRRDRSGLLATRDLTLPGTVGVNLPQENLNRDMRRGMELVLGHTKSIGQVQYNLSANISYTRGQATHIERSADHNSYLNWRNNTTNRWDNITWGYQVLGQFQSYEEILSSPLQDNPSQGNRFLLPGDIKYKDINNDGIINSMDMVPIGKGTIPDINFGINSGITYKQFDVNFLFQGASGFNYIDGFWYDRGLLWLGRNGQAKFFDRWHRQDPYKVDSPWIPGRFPSAYDGGNGRGNRADSEFWIRDAKYIRLKSLDIGYTLNPALFAKAGIKSLRLTASGHNLLTWTGLEDVDPERGDQLTYPITRMFNFGVNVQF